MAALQDSNWPASSSTIFVVRLVRRACLATPSIHRKKQRRRLKAQKVTPAFLQNVVDQAWLQHCTVRKGYAKASFRSPLLQGSAVIYNKSVKRGHKKYCTSNVYWKVYSVRLDLSYAELPLEKFKSALLGSRLHSSQLRVKKLLSIIINNRIRCILLDSAISAGHWKASISSFPLQLKASDNPRIALSELLLVYCTIYQANKYLQCSFIYSILLIKDEFFWTSQPQKYSQIVPYVILRSGTLKRSSFVN